jgi:N-acetylmuramoyl-L-alanine amidase
MASAAFLFACGVLLTPLALAGTPADGSPRAVPTRPGATPPAAAAGNAPRAAATSAGPTKKFGASEYLSVPDIAAQLALRTGSGERGRRASLVGNGVRADLEKDSREITANGLRVFLGEPVLESGGHLYVSRTDYERALTPLLKPGVTASPATAPKVIVLDPGHGGKDNGTSANEKTFALDVARRAKRILETAGHQVVLTRDTDVFLDLPQRSALAVANGAQLFASIHFNALANDAKTSGVEVFTFAPQFQRSTNSWGPRENGDAEKDAAPVNRFDHWSSVLAHAIQRRFVEDLNTFDRGKKIAHWGVLRGLTCPGVLVECGFLTSKEEARKIATPAYRQKIAEAIASGIRDYAATVERARAPRTAGGATPS